MEKGGTKMTTLLLGTMLLTSVMVVPIPTMAGDIDVSFPLPPSAVFEAPPEVVALPDTNDVYVSATLFAGPPLFSQKRRANLSPQFVNSTLCLTCSKTAPAIPMR